MKRNLIALALICGILSTTAFTQQTKSPHLEYRFVYQCDEKKANSHATEGWELVNLSMAAHGSIGVGTCAFKRVR